jgi:hypothetical protein
LTMLPSLGSSEWKDVGGMAILAFFLWGVCFAISCGGFLLIRSELKK